MIVHAITGFIDHLNTVAQSYQVDPLIFVLIYILTTGPFLFVSGWLFHNIRREKPLEILIFVWALFYSAPYLYVLAVGRHLPVWVYVVVAALIVCGLTLAARGLKRRLRRDRGYDEERRRRYTRSTASDRPRWRR